MNNNELRFENFLRGHLSKEDEKILELEMKSNEELGQEFELFRDAFDVVGYMERKEIYNKVREKYEAKGSERKLRSGFYIVVAIVLIFSLLYFGYTRFYIAEPVEMAEDLFEPYPDRITTMGDETSILLDAMSLYNSRKYELAINKFDDLVENESAAFYKSISHMAIEEYEIAKQILLTIHNDQKHPYYEASGWYLALSHLSLGETGKAKFLLEKIVNDPNLTFHKADALELLTQLE